MELNHDEVTTAPAAAASIVLLRDAPRGMEVLLLQRHASSSVLGGAHVFPGGKLDPDDMAVGASACLDREPEVLHAALREQGLAVREAAGLFVAAMREAYEEAGLLFTKGATPAQAGLADLRAAEGFSFNGMLADLSLCLDTSRLVPWSRWITPKVPSVTSRRFDTRFFVAVFEEEMEISHDNYEAVGSAWLRPREALEAYWAGRMMLAPPQIMSLAHLSRHESASQVLAEARAAGPALVEPLSCQIDGERVVCYPGDERHAVPRRALPGPSRLVFRNKRFEPFDGFEGLFR
jgi:8-oxo-dGTP pyrophosphatase MutT (NUDIX family)